MAVQLDKGMLKTKRYKFGPRQRLRNQAEFDRVFAGGRRLRHRDLLFILRWNRLRRPRLGISVGRRFGNAVQRNRMKRRLREAFRLMQHELPPSDIVCVPYPKASKLSVEMIQEAFRKIGEPRQNAKFRR